MYNTFAFMFLAPPSDDVHTKLSPSPTSSPEAECTVAKANSVLEGLRCVGQRWSKVCVAIGVGVVL